MSSGKSKKRKAIQTANALRKARMHAESDSERKERREKKPTKYSLRKDSRDRGEPMKERANPPWWMFGNGLGMNLG